MIGSRHALAALSDRLPLATTLLLAVALVGCAAGASDQGKAAPEPTASQEADLGEPTTAPSSATPERAASVRVDAPGLTLGLPEDMSWSTVGLHTPDATELSGAVHGRGDPVDLVLVWQDGHRPPADALDGALTALADRGIEVSHGERVKLEAGSGLAPTAQTVTLASTSGTTHGLAAVWSCPDPQRTVSLVVHGGNDDEHASVAGLVLAEFDCHRA